MFNNKTLLKNTGGWVVNRSSHFLDKKLRGSGVRPRSPSKITIDPECHLNSDPQQIQIRKWSVGEKKWSVNSQC